jgi:hypothetical protein
VRLLGASSCEQYQHERGERVSSGNHHME